MMSIEKIQDINLNAVKQWPGLLSILLYTNAHDEFRSFVRRHWKTLDELSGERLLMMVGDTGGRRPINTDKLADGLSSLLGVRLDELPCIILMDSSDAR
jgi:hypothetical protein